MKTTGFVGKYCIVRSYGAGVHAGIVHGYGSGCGGDDDDDD